ncbi:hypothetical protein [Merismopedia glauca]|uniref:Uncharacterized protein n=1 Tax=Merismopedia glauca CCAP 1448/3 TaxID=1296344 RepID=A0A2T1C801_9CYAN|nr:hypothetical protein [Merismopedia glauca]PSB04283.1 hypothetical protein C7B64_04810 [Merismopedia glauca CCAP 1448/3]
MKNSENNLENLNQEIIRLRKRLDNIESSLAFPESRQLNKALEIPKVSKIKLSEGKLVEVFNDVPQLLSAYATSVSLTASSYRQINQMPIVLENANWGNYWVIATEDDYWLLPNIKLKLNIHKLKTIKYLFKLEKKSSANTDEYSLIKPAKVSLMPNGCEWKLEASGKIEFGSYREFQWRSELEIIDLQSQKLQSLLEQADRQSQELQSQIDRIPEERSLLISQLSESLNNWRKNLTSQLDLDSPQLETSEPVNAAIKKFMNFTRTLRDKF